MRVLLVVALILLAGCTLPGEPEEDAPAIFGVCPQWITSGDVLEAEANVDAAVELVMAPEHNGTLVEAFQGHALDMYLIRVNTTAPVQLRAYHDAGDRRLLLMEEVSSKFESKPVVTIDSSAEVQAFLTAVVQGTASDPGALRVLLSPVDGAAVVELSVSPFYRVCGIAANAADSRP